jgi:hypothetical protein
MNLVALHAHRSGSGNQRPAEHVPRRGSSTGGGRRNLSLVVGERSLTKRIAGELTSLGGVAVDGGAHPREEV